jgi:N-acetylglucosamine-6-phosphate deacetylase
MNISLENWLIKLSKFLSRNGTTSTVPSLMTKELRRLNFLYNASEITCGPLWTLGIEFENPPLMAYSDSCR